MLTPADRIELNGPYYALSWNQYTVPLLPSDQLGQAGLLGRDDGGDRLGNVGQAAICCGTLRRCRWRTQPDGNSLFAARVAFNFLSMEANPAYYTSSTYYGGGAATCSRSACRSRARRTAPAPRQRPADFSAVIVDALFEKPFENGGAITLEAEHKSFDAPAADGWQRLLLPIRRQRLVFHRGLSVSGRGGHRAFAAVLRYTSNEPSDAAIGDSELSEYGLNYIINGHNLRLNVHVTDGDANLTGAPGADETRFGFGVQVQI